MLFVLAIILASQNYNYDPADVERNNTAIRAFLACATEQGRRLAIGPDAADLIADAAIAYCSQQEGEVRRTMYGTAPDTGAADQSSDEVRRLVRNRALLAIIEARAAPTR